MSSTMLDLRTVLRILFIPYTLIAFYYLFYVGFNVLFKRLSNSIYHISNMILFWITDFAILDLTVLHPKLFIINSLAVWVTILFTTYFLLYLLIITYRAASDFKSNGLNLKDFSNHELAIISIVSVLMVEFIIFAFKNISYFTKDMSHLSIFVSIFAFLISLILPYYFDWKTNRRDIKLDRQNMYLLEKISDIEKSNQEILTRLEQVNKTNNELQDKLQLYDQTGQEVLSKLDHLASIPKKITYINKKPLKKHRLGSIGKYNGLN